MTAFVLGVCVLACTPLVPGVALAQLGFTPCTIDADCNDGIFCNGTEQCIAGLCAIGANPCPNRLCNEATDTCVDCVTGCAEAPPCLAGEQSVDGSFGAQPTLHVRDTTAVLDTLRLLGQKGTSFSKGLNFVDGAPNSNHDDVARKIVSLTTTGRSVAALDTELIDGQAEETLDPTEATYPEGGWGVAPGFQTDVLTTALALRALQTSAVSTGLSVVHASVVSGTPNIHHFSFPAGGSGLILLIREVTGSVRLFIQTPSSGTLFVDLSNVVAPTTLGGLPQQEGTYTLTVQSLAGSPNTYSLEARFVSGDFDAARVTRALSYLGYAQNPDGSWGIRRGESGLLIATTEVLQTLQAYGNSFAPFAALSAGAGWLAGQQNPDGGFGGTAGASTVSETALAVLAIAGTTPASPALAAAKTFLLNTQGANGCWNDDAYSTALALRALAESVVAASVDLQGRPAKPNAAWSTQLQVSLNPSGQANPVIQFSPTTDQDGMFIVSGITPGTYDIHVKGSHTLRTTQTVTLTLGSNAVNVGPLREGDANNDNFVTLTDFSILATSFGKCTGVAGYDARADFNQSGCVTLQDFSLLATNFGQAGDP